MRSILSLAGVLVFSSLASAAFAEPIAAPAIQASATRAVAVLEKSIRVWHQNRTCFSCHHQGLAIALVAEARTRGIVVDDALARTNISVGLQGLKSLDRAVQAAQQIDPAADTGSQLVAAKVAGVPRGLVREVYAATVAKRQRPDGGWETLDNRPPQAWSRVSATTSRSKESGPTCPRTENRRPRRGPAARATGCSRTPRDTEDRAFQIFGALEAGVGREAVKPMATALVAEQRADGGWAQLPSRSSDAYATGEALVALYDAGLGPADPAIRRGLSYCSTRSSRTGPGALKPGCTSRGWSVRRFRDRLPAGEIE